MEKNQFLLPNRLATRAIQLLTVVYKVFSYIQGAIRKRSLRTLHMKERFIIENLMFHDLDALNHFCRERWYIDDSYIDEIEIDN